MTLLATLLALAAVDTPAPRPLFQRPIPPDREEILLVAGVDSWTAPLEGGEARLLVSHPASGRRQTAGRARHRMEAIDCADRAATSHEEAACAEI